MHATGVAMVLENSDKDGYFKLRLNGDDNGYFWGKYWANFANNYADYPNETYFQLVNSSDKNYKLHPFSWDGTDNAYVYINTENSNRLACNSNEQTDLDEGYVTWQFVTKNDYLEYVGNSINPGDDVTETFIFNWDFTNCANNDFFGWTIYAPNGGNTWKNGDTRVEYWIGNAADGVFDYYQTVTGLLDGEYEISASMWNTQVGTPNGNAGVYAVCGNQTEFAGVTIDGETLNTYSTTIVVSNDEMRLGVKNNGTMAARWFGVDWIKLKYLGRALANDAVALPESNAMEANKWYYFDVAIEGDYKLTCSSLSDIVYTTDGSTLIASSITTNFSNNIVSLDEGRYYVKSSSAQTLKVSANSFNYNVGPATLSIADGSYQKTINTVTFTFAEAASNDDDATFAVLSTDKALLKQSGSTVAEGKLSLDGKVLTATFTETTLALGSTYTLELPANVVGYAGKASNEAVTINVNTPVIADGFYYLKTSDNKYLSRGLNYNTQAIADSYGIPMRVNTNENGITEFIFIDNWFHLFDAAEGNLYTDNNSANDFAIEATTGGYYVVNKNDKGTKDGKLYIDANDGNRVKVSMTDATVWQFEDATTTAHKTQMQAVKDAQAAAVAFKAGISASSQEAMANAVKEYKEASIVINGTSKTSESWQQGGGNGWNSGPLEIYKETVSNVKPGLYRLSVKAFERITWPADVYNAGGAAGLTYLYANDEKVQLYSLFDYPSDKKWKDTDQVFDNKYYADRTDAAQAAFDAGNYQNVVYVWVTADEGKTTGTITFGINKPHRYGNDGNRGAWVCYNNFSLTYLSNAEYEVGPATLDDEYVQSGQTVKVTYRYLSAKNPDAQPTLDASKVKFNGTAVECALADKGFTFVVPEVATGIKDRSLSLTIEAGAIGYEGGVFNETETFTFNTPDLFDGHYYIKKDGADLYFSRGGDDNKQAVLDKFGVPVKITTDGNNVSRLKFVDTGLLLGASGTTGNYKYWTDKGDGSSSNWTIVKSGDKYKFYLPGVEDGKKGMNVDGDLAPKSDTEANACEWEVELPAAHLEKLQAVKDAQAASVATAMSYAGVSTQEEMKAYLENNLGETPISITGTEGANKEAWQASAPTGTGKDSVIIEEKIENLKAGLYRLRVYGFERIADGKSVYDAGGAAGLAYVYANDQKVKLASLFDVQADTPWQSGNDLQFGGKYYANSQTGAQAAFDAGNYANDVYVKIDEGGTITFGIKQPNCYYQGDKQHNNNQWICYNNFSLTYFENKASESQLTGLDNAIKAVDSKLGFEEGEYAPYTNVEACEALAEAKAIHEANIYSGTTVEKARTTLNGVTWTPNATQMDAVYNGDWANSTPNVESGVGVDVPGWSKHVGFRIITNSVETYPGISDASQGKVLMVWGNNSIEYGNTTGYTMPLAAHTIYELTFKYAAWKDGGTNGGAVTASVKNGDTGMATIQVGTIYEDKRITSANTLATANIKFVTAEAGDYVLTLKGAGHIVFTDISIKKAASQVLEFADGAEMPKYAPGTYPSVKISRSMEANRWYTAVYPFAVSGVDKIAVLDSYNDGVLGFTTEDVTTSEANEPFLMRSNSKKTEIELSNVAVAAAAEAPEVTVGDVLSLKGVYTTTEVKAAEGVTNYVLSDNKIYKVGDNAATVNPYHAYIQLAQSAGESRELTFTVDGEATGISEVKAQNNAADGNIYNLNGQRVKNAKKGVYIMNGKTVIVK